MQFETLHQEFVHNAEVIRTLVVGLTPAEARFQPLPESWSVLEVICHLYDEEREDFRPRLDTILHRPAEKWAPIDPEGWVTTRRYNERDLSEALNGFLVERDKSLAWLRKLTVPNWEAEYMAPFGVIRAGDMVASWVAHDMLHIRQLVELRYGRILSLTEPYAVRYAGEW
jgi:hypothetical protein